MKYLYLITLFTILTIGTLMFLKVGEVAHTKAQDKVFMESVRMMDRATPTMEFGRER